VDAVAYMYIPANYAMFVQFSNLWTSDTFSKGHILNTIHFVVFPRSLKHTVTDGPMKQFLYMLYI